MKVLHVIASMSVEWGGPPVTVCGLTAALERQDVRCEIATTSEPGRRPHGVNVASVPTRTFDVTSLSRVWAGYSPTLTAFLETTTDSFDLVHAHEIWPYTTLAAFRAARTHARPFVLTPHGELNERHLRYKRLKKWCYRKLVLDRVLRQTNALHAVARNELAHASQLGHLTPVFHIPNGVTPPQPNDSMRSAAFFHEHPTLRNRRLILFMGRLHPMKGVEILSRSFLTIASSFPDAVLIVAGPDEGERHKMDSIFDSAGLTHRVLFPGLITGDKKQNILDAADVFVLPSYFEGFPNSVLEALANGIPVVISEQCNFPEVAAAGAGLISPLNPAQLSSAIGRILSSDDRRRTMGAAARKLVSEHYTWDNLAQAMVDQYTTAINRRQIRHP